MAGSPYFFPEGGEPIPNESDTRTLQKVHGILWDLLGIQGGGGGVGPPAESNITQFNSQPVDTGNGTAGAGTQRVAIASDNTPFEVNTNLVKVAGTATATGNGVVTAGTQRVVLASDGTAFTVNASEVTGTISSAGVALVPKFAIIDAATSGDNTLVAAVAAKKIRVLSVLLVSAGIVNVRFESGASGTALSGQMNLIANTGFAMAYSPLGLFETAAGSLLNIELSAAISVDGFLTYIEV